VSVELTVVGSINLDLVARVDALPRAGETVPGTSFERFPGGKGANQAVAAARLGARVRMIGAVGTDPLADEALVGLQEAGVELDIERIGETGIALILVAADGENQIVVVPGANAAVRPQSPGGAVLCQLEVPDAVVAAAARDASFFALNAAPARPVELEPDLLIVNTLEHEVVSRGKLVAVTYGAEGAALFEDGREVARARPPRVDAVDGTAAGDAFAACLVVSLLEGRSRDEALTRACAAGAVAATRLGAQPSLPDARELDAILTSRRLDGDSQEAEVPAWPAPERKR
jgi:ribokinase